MLSIYFTENGDNKMNKTRNENLHKFSTMIITLVMITCFTLKLTMVKLDLEIFLFQKMMKKKKKFETSFQLLSAL